MTYKLLPHLLVEVIKQKTIETSEKLTKIKTTTEKISCTITGVQWGSDIMHTCVYMCVCVQMHTHTYSLNNYKLTQQVSLHQLIDPDYPCSIFINVSSN